MFVKEELGKLPRKLFIETDNCSRDLKNQYLFSFYWSLVDLGIFEQVIVSHMPVGHTHGEVDQIFSMFASHLRKLEIPTFEKLLIELKKIKIKSVPIIVKEMEYATDFVKRIVPSLLNIDGHRSFFQFMFRKENEKTKMYVKADMLDNAWQFGDGIKLFETLPDLKNLTIAPFRTESEYSEIFKSVWNKYIPSLEGKYGYEQIQEVKKLWESRITRLIGLKEANFQAFDIFKLVTTPNTDDLAIDVVEEVLENEPTLTATFYPVEIKDFDVEDLVEDCSIVFYTRSKTSRPWIGLFMGMDNEGPTARLKVQWVKKVKKLYVLDTVADGSPYLSFLDIDSVMFTSVLRNVSFRSARTGPYLLDRETRTQIMKAYVERDSVLGV